MSQLRIKYLLDNYFANNLSDVEQQELMDLLRSKDFDEIVKKYLLKTYPKSNSKHLLDDIRSQRILSSIINNQQTIPKSKKQTGFWRLPGIPWVAASILIVSSILFYSINHNNKTNESIALNSAKSELGDDVAPGTTGAILKLADGSIVLLDSIHNKAAIKQGNTLVINSSGSLNYQNLDKSNKGKNIGFNTVETPKGQQFHLSLVDGTQVWLNAASSISFPVEFNGSERDVKITGEVYFEVAKNKNKPFHVSVNGTTVEVLGTHFNINSYGDEGTVNTTLLEGAVKITKDQNQQILKPGDQARVHSNGQITKLTNINTDEIVAWKNNFFSFNNTDIKNVMKQLARWYDVEVDYKGITDDSITFNGDISRSVNLSTVLKMLESTGAVSFTIKDKKVSVSM